MKELGKLYVAVECDNCGRHGEGVPTGEIGNRCTKCGRFAASADEYCAKHDLDYRGFYLDDSHCPKCREENRVNAMEREMHQRRADPNMHPTIDAPRR